jgi:hypothetical protein
MNMKRFEIKYNYQRHQFSTVRKAETAEGAKTKLLAEFGTYANEISVKTIKPAKRRV